MSARIEPPPVNTSHFEPRRLARVHDAMRRHVDSGAVPGLVLLLTHRGREYVDAIGSMAYSGSEPIRRDAICRLASMTKPITAVGAMILIEECRLRLDDPVDDWLPELKDARVLRDINSRLDDTVPAKRSITVRDLLTFRSGYGEVGFISPDRTLEKALLSPTCPLQKAMIEARLPLSAWRFAGTSDEFMQRVGSLPLAFQPGERWLYHMSAEILGVLIARVSGQSLGTFLHERIFEPLGMRDTAFYVPESKLPRVPTCYGADMVTRRRVVLDEARGDWAQPPAFEAGGGGLVSTVDDMAAFGSMMLNHGSYGSQRILARPTVEAMTTDQLTPQQKAVSPFFENFLGRPRLGVRCWAGDEANWSSGSTGPVWLGWCLWLVVVGRSQGRTRGRTHGATSSRLARYSPHDPRLLDLCLPVN